MRNQSALRAKAALCGGGTHVDGGTREHSRDLPTLFGGQKHRRIIADGCKYHGFPNEPICRKFDANDACRPGRQYRRAVTALLMALSGHRLLHWDFRVHDRRVHAIHMIFVAQQAVLTRRAAVVTGLAQILFHLAEIGHEILRVALFVAL